MTGTEWVAIAGIAGTLAAAIAGAIVASKIAAHEMLYRERTRFHNTRLGAYAKFLGLANSIVGASRAGNAPSPASRQGFVEATETLRLVASPVVFAAAQLVHNDVTGLVLGKVDDLASFLPKFNTHVVVAATHMRTELGINPRLGRWQRFVRHLTSVCSRRAWLSRRLHRALPRPTHPPRQP